MKKSNKIPIGPHKVKNRDLKRDAMTRELPHPIAPKKTNFKKPVALKQKAGTGGYENPQSAFQRDAHL